MQHIISSADDGIRLDRWFKRHLPHVPHGMLEKTLRKGQIRLDGKKAKAAQRVAAGQTIDVRLQVADIKKEKPPSAIRCLTDEDVRFVQSLVLYKDANVIVINKPPGLAVQGGTKQERHLDAMLDALRFEAEDRPRLVHRLDKDTSGCLVLGRSAKAASVLAQKFADRKTRKIYHALVIGLPMPMVGTIDLPLSKQERGKDSRTEVYEDVAVDEKSGLSAQTEYRVLAHCATKLSWVELRPITGRTHQLRVHMAAKGHPIVGDGKYGGKEAFVRGSLGLSQKLHLHAARLVIADVFGKTIDVKAPPPEHIKKSLKALEIDA